MSPGSLPNRCHIHGWLARHLHLDPGAVSAHTRAVVAQQMGRITYSGVTVTHFIVSVEPIGNTEC